VAITQVKEHWSGRSGNIDDKFTREYMRVFLVKSDTNYDAAFNVRSDVRIPRIWDSYVTVNESDAAALCQKIECEQFADEPQFWKVSCRYSTKIADQTQQTENPLDKPADISWDVEQGQIALDRAVVADSALSYGYSYSGDLIANSAGDPYDPPVTIEDARMILTITRNEATFSAQLAYDYTNTINSDDFFGAPAHTWKCEGISGRRRFERNVLFWEVTYKFKWNPNTWKLKILDAGLREKVSGVLRPITDGGRPVTQPALLASTGAKLAVGGTPNHKSFDVYFPKAFGGLRLP
jgi:hypothetical protein